MITIRTANSLWDIDLQMHSELPDELDEYAAGAAEQLIHRIDVDLQQWDAVMDCNGVVLIPDYHNELAVTAYLADIPHTVEDVANEVMEQQGL